MAGISEKYTLDTSQAVSAIDKLTQATENAFQSSEQLRKKIEEVGSTKTGDQAATSYNRANTSLAKWAVGLFSVSRMARMVSNAVKRAPDEIAAPFKDLSKTISDGFARPVIALMQGMTAGVNKLNAAFASNAGQKFLRGMEQLGRAAGAAMGVLFEIAVRFVEFMGNNFQSVVKAAAFVVGVWAVEMLKAAAAALAANFGAILLVGAIVGVIKIMNAFGVSASDVLGAVAGGISVVMAFFVNLGLLAQEIAFDISSVFGMVVEDIQNGFKNAINRVKAFFAGLAASALNVIAKIAEGLNMLPFVTIDYSGLISQANAFAAKQSALGDGAQLHSSADYAKIYAEGQQKYNAFAEGWASDAFAKGKNAIGGFVDTFSDLSLQNAVATPLKNIDAKAGGIGKDVGSIKKSVNMAEEDIKSLVDVAERRFVNMVNLTSQSPVINVQGQNTGRTEEDRRALADTLAAMLLEQFDAGSNTTTAMAF